MFMVFEFQYFSRKKPGDSFPGRKPSAFEEAGLTAFPLHRPAHSGDETPDGSVGVEAKLTPVLGILCTIVGKIFAFVLKTAPKRSVHSFSVWCRSFSRGISAT